MREKGRLNTRPSVLHQPGLADARNALQQHVAAGDDGDDRGLHDLLHADDVTPDLLENVFALLAELSDIRFVYHNIFFLFLYLIELQ